MTAVARAELLAEPGARIRFKPFFAADTSLETMLVLHRVISIARQLNGNNERVADFQRCVPRISPLSGQAVNLNEYQSHLSANAPPRRTTGSC